MTLGTPRFQVVNGVRGVEVVDVELVGTAPVVYGWTFAGVVEFTPGGNLLKGIPGGIGMPEKYRNVDCSCDHCGYNRRRNSVVVITKGTEWKQVGTDCIEDYIRSADASEALRVMTMLDDIQHCIEVNSAEDGMGGGRGDGYSVIGFLAVVAAAIESKGWTPRSKADYDHPATVDVVLANEGKIQASDANIAEAQEAIQWGQNLTPKSDYEHNVQVVCSASYCSFRNTGILASVLASYRASRNRAVEAAKSEYLGKVGDKVQWTLTLRSRYVMDGMYGATTILTFVDSCGNVIVWKASGVQLDEDARGTVFVVKGTIKKHEEYKGTKQTLLTRCKLVKQQ